MTEKIKFVDPPEHINPYLTHCTGRSKSDEEAFEILSLIINSRELKFGQNTISYHSAKPIVKQAMICFTTGSLLWFRHPQTYI